MHFKTRLDNGHMRSVNKQLMHLVSSHFLGMMMMHDDVTTLITTWTSRLLHNRFLIDNNHLIDPKTHSPAQVYVSVYIDMYTYIYVSVYTIYIYLYIFSIFY